MLRMVLIGIGLVVVAAGTLVGCVWLRSNVGHVGVIGLCLTSGMAAWVANALAKEIADAATAAMHDIGLSLKEAAAQMGKDIALASRELSGERRLDYASWATLDGWEAAFARRRAAQNGGYTVIDDGVVATALAKLTRILDERVSA